MFKMSVRQPVKYGEEYWSQYGEYYHANGEKKEKGSVTHLSREHKEGQFSYHLFFSCKVSSELRNQKVEF